MKSMHMPAALGGQSRGISLGRAMPAQGPTRAAKYLVVVHAVLRASWQAADTRELDFRRRRTNVFRAGAG